MDEPTVGELLRDVQADVRRILDQQQTFVTKELNDRMHAEHAKRLDALEEGRRTTQRMVLSAFVLPLLVILVAAWLGGRP